MSESKKRILSILSRDGSELRAAAVCEHAYSTLDAKLI